ncbi:MAG: hypothetical protein ABSF45_29265 [Terriglobia bacterium]
MAEFIYQLYADKRFASDPLFRRIASKENDLEYLLEELEDWRQKGYILRDTPPESSIQNSLGNSDKTVPLPSLPDTIDFTGIPKQAADLQDALRKKVFETYKDINDRTKAASLFVPLLDGIFTQLNPQKFPLVVFTTNYDPAVEVFCEQCSSSYELEDGFLHDQAAGAFFWKRENFDSFTFVGQRKTIVLFKLHGSARWVRRGNQIMKLPFAVYADTGEDYQNALIYPATRKVALDDPFFTAYDYFQRTMDACGCCIVIGYSFRDYDALTKLVSASIFNSRLKLLVVDPNATALCQQLSKRGIRCTAASQEFGKDGEYLHWVSVHVAEAVKT